MERLKGMVVFVKVVQVGSFSGAARALDMPKSTVSRQVAHLEDRLGVRLLNRTTRTLALTDIGAAYYERAARIVESIEEAEEAVTQLTTRPRGTLRLSAPVTLGRLFIGQLVAGFITRFPEVRVDVALNDRMVDIIEEGYDLAIRAAALEDSSFIVRKLGSSRRVICASPAYLERAGTPRRPEDLRAHDCLRYAHERTGGAWRLSEGHVVQVDGPLVSNNGDVLRQAALAGLGLVLIPRFMVGPELRSGALVPVLQEHTSDEGGVYAMYPHNRHLSAKVRAFVDFAVEQFTPAPWESC
ncbi:MAG: LysR family transcriptional regulator [Alphaproteobacteria bacterium]|nr:LysR family transcriptional regulator [Alphaproteobacteria bacterium]